MDFPFGSIQVDLQEANSRLLGTDWRATDYSDNVSRIYWTASGRGSLGHHGCTFVLRPGCIFLIPAGTLFSYSCENRLYQHWIHFTASLPGGLPLFEMLEPAYEVEPEDRQQVLRHFVRLERLLALGSPAARLEKTGILLQLLALFMPAGGEDAFDRRRKAYLRFGRTLEYVDANLSGPLSVAELARTAHLERTYFSRTFHRSLEMKPSEYIARRRIDRARQLLWTTQQPLRVIAASLGFTDEFHFSRRFKKFTGLSPSEFRKMRGPSSPAPVPGAPPPR